MKNGSRIVGMVVALVFIIAMIPAANAYEPQAPPNPVVVFDATPQSGVVPLNVSFTDNSTGPGTLYYLWDFGDGNTSTLQSPFHVYEYVGNFTVSLNVSLRNPTRSSILTKPDYIIVSAAPIPPSADFIGIPQSGAVPLNVTFTSLATGTEPLTYAWDFGDGSVDTAPNPVHTYTNAGVYNVSLIVSNVVGTNTTIKNNYITVVIPPIADFTGLPQSGVVPLTVSFTGNVTGTAPMTYLWDFGDGSLENATVLSPVHTFANAGIYNVSLTASNAGGSNTSTRFNYITVTYMTDKIGVVSSYHTWNLDYNGNGTWDGNVIDRQYALGKVGDVPVVGDWNGNRITEISVFRDNHTWYIDYNGNGVWDSPAMGDRIYTMGKPGDIPVPGDWNGDNVTEMAVFRDSHNWYIDYNGNGIWDSPTGGDRIYTTGQLGDIPVPGDWNGDYITEMAVFRGSHTWYIDYNGNGIWDSPFGGDRIYTTGQPGDLPVVGDWNGDVIAEMGVFRPSNHNFYLDFNANGLWDGASVDKRYDFGTFGDIPISGKW